MKISDMCKKKKYLIFSEEEISNVQGMAEAFILLMDKHSNTKVDRDLSISYFMDKTWKIKEKVSPYKPMKDDLLFKMGQELILRAFNHYEEFLKEAKEAKECIGNIDDAEYGKDIIPIETSNKNSMN